MDEHLANQRKPNFGAVEVITCRMLRNRGDRRARTSSSTFPETTSRRLHHDNLLRQQSYIHFNFPRHNPVAAASTMTNIAVPRTAIRALSRARPSVNSRTVQGLATTRPAQRCLHQTSSPASFATVRHRPTTSSLSARNATRFGAVESRRTMFIQTENTPNPDVSFPFPR